MHPSDPEDWVIEYRFAEGNGSMERTADMPLEWSQVSEYWYAGNGTRGQNAMVMRSLEEIVAHLYFIKGVMADFYHFRLHNLKTNEEIPICAVIE